MTDSSKMTTDSSKMTTDSSKMTTDPSYPSICIPRTFLNITVRQVKSVFEQVFGLNTIERVDMIRRKGADGKEFQRVFVHFKEWPKYEDAQRIREKLLANHEVKLVYSEPWFWKCRASTSTKPSQQRKKKFTPYIHLSDSDNEQDPHKQEPHKQDDGPTFPSHPPPPAAPLRPPTLARCHTSSIANNETD